MPKRMLSAVPNSGTSSEHDKDDSHQSTTSHSTTNTKVAKVGEIHA
jgi:hypothetical protein